MYCGLSQLSALTQRSSLSSEIAVTAHTSTPNYFFRKQPQSRIMQLVPRERFFQHGSFPNSEFPGQTNFNESL